MEAGADKCDFSFNHLKYLISSDLYRYHGEIGFREFWKHFLAGEGSKYMIWCRTTRYLSTKGPLFRPLFLFAGFTTKKLRVKYGISIPWYTEIGPGFYIGHYGGIFVGPGVVIGKNCNISQGVTIGMSNRGRAGVPRIGDDVYIGPGAKLFGRIRIGNNVAIGANAVVGRNIRSDCIVVSAPPEIIVTDNPSFAIYGSKGYVNRTDYDSRICSPAGENP